MYRVSQKKVGSQKTSNCSNSLNFEAKIKCNTIKPNVPKWRKTCTGLKFDLLDFYGPQSNIHTFWDPTFFWLTLYLLFGCVFPSIALILAVPGFDVCLVFLRFSIFSCPCLYPSKAFPKLNHKMIWNIFFFFTNYF